MEEVGDSSCAYACLNCPSLPFSSTLLILNIPSDHQRLLLLLLVPVQHAGQRAGLTISSFGCWPLLELPKLAMLCRRLERVHGAVVGTHARHANLLPLEMYLEEGIPLVLYVRDSHNAEMVELPEQSCHAFISFATAHGSATCPPSIKACLCLLARADTAG